MLHPAWLNEGITSFRKLTGLTRSIPETSTVAWTSTLPPLATMVALPFPTGTTCPLALTVATAGSRLVQVRARVRSRIDPSASVAEAINWRVPRWPIRVDCAGSMTTFDGVPIGPSEAAAGAMVRADAAERTSQVIRRGTRMSHSSLGGMVQGWGGLTPATRMVGKGGAVGSHSSRAVCGAVARFAAGRTTDDCIARLAVIS